MIGWLRRRYLRIGFGFLDHGLEEGMVAKDGMYIPEAGKNPYDREFANLIKRAFKWKRKRGRGGDNNLSHNRESSRCSKS